MASKRVKMTIHYSNGRNGIAFVNEDDLIADIKLLALGAGGAKSLTVSAVLHPDYGAKRQGMPYPKKIVYVRK